MSGCFPSIGYGTFDLRGDVVSLVKTAIRAGYRLIDTAQGYGTEAAVGQALGELVRDGEIRRGDVFVQSKITNAYGYEDTLATVNEALSASGLGYFDSYLIHWPVMRYRENSWRDDNAATWSAMEALQAEGKIRDLGVSNFAERHLMSLLKRCAIPPRFNQLEIHPDYQQRGLVESCRDWGIEIQAWSPLGRGLVESRAIKDMAEKYGHTEGQLLLSWSVQNGFIPLVRSSDPDRIAANLHTFEVRQEDMRELDAMNTADNHLDAFSYKRREMY
jgi:diketogulonate reductase-like aldo/keto reductase